MSSYPTIRPDIPIPELHVYPGQSLVVIGYNSDGGAKVYQLLNRGIRGEWLLLTELTPKTEAKQ